MLTRLDVIAKGEAFPPGGDKDRLEVYEDMDDLLEGEHLEVFAESFTRLLRENNTIIEINLPWPRKVRLIFADLLCGEPGRIKCQDESQQEYLDGLVRQLDLWRMLHECCGDTISYGDGVLKLRRTNGRSRLSPLPPKFWFPVVAEDDVREITGHIIAWKINEGTPAQPKWVAKIEKHEPGSITTYRVRLNHDGSKMVDVEELGTVKSGVDGFLIFHAPAWRTSAELHGHAVFADADSILSEIEVRFSQASRVLDKHSDPGMYGPDAALIFNEATKKWEFKADRFVPLEKDDKPPGYVTWDGKLEPNVEIIKLLTEQLYAATDTCPALFGKLEQGMAESGSALKRLLISPLAAVNRLRLTYDTVVKDVLATAAELEGTTLAPLKVVWRDGLPEDALEAANIEQQRVAAGNTSVRSSVVRLDGLEGQALEDEIGRIEKDKQSQRSTAAPPAVALPPKTLRPPERTE